MKFKGINFTRQQLKYDCVPVALFNSLKYYGWKGSYRNEKDFLFKFFNVRSEPDFKGVDYKDVMRCFKHLKKANKLPFKIKKIKKFCSNKDVMEHLDSGGTLIFSYVMSPFNNHAVFAFKECNNIYFVNKFHNYTISMVTEKYVNKLLKTFNLGVFLVTK